MSSQSEATNEIPPMTNDIPREHTTQDRPQASSGLPVPSQAAVDSAESKDRLDNVLHSDIGVTTLLNRLKQSISSARDFATFLRKRSTLEDDHAQGLKKLSRGTYELIRRPENLQGSFAQNYEEITRIHERMADHGLAFAMALSQMSDELHELSATMERGRKHWKQNGLNAERRVQDSEAALEKAQMKYTQLAEQYDRARTGDRQSGRFGIKGPKSAAQQEEDLHRKAEAADVDYASKVQTAQAQRQELDSSLRPQAISALRDLITECDSGLVAHLQKFATLNEQLLLRNGLCVSPLRSEDNGASMQPRSLREVIHQIDNEGDFRDHILSFSNKAGKRASVIKYEKHPALAQLTPTPSNQFQPQQSLVGGPSPTSVNQNQSPGGPYAGYDHNARQNQPGQISGVTQYQANNSNGQPMQSRQNQYAQGPGPYPQQGPHSDAPQMRHNQNQYAQSQNQYAQGQNQYAQGQNQYAQGQNQYAQGQNQYAQGQNQYAQGQNQYAQGQNQYGSGQMPSSQGQNQYGSGQMPSSQGQNQYDPGQMPSTQGQSSYVQGVQRDAQPTYQQPQSQGPTSYNQPLKISSYSPNNSQLPPLPPIDPLSMSGGLQPQRSDVIAANPRNNTDMRPEMRYQDPNANNHMPSSSGPSTGLTGGPTSGPRGDEIPTIQNSPRPIIPSTGSVNNNRPITPSGGSAGAVRGETAGPGKSGTFQQNITPIGPEGGSVNNMRGEGPHHSGGNTPQGGNQLQAGNQMQGTGVSPTTFNGAPKEGSKMPRPNLPALRPVFGVSLDELFRRDSSAVPMIVYQCVQAVDLFGLDVEGIYRTSGSAPHIMEMKALFDNDSSQVDFRNPAAFHHDIASVTTLLKHFLRDLPDPLLTSANYTSFINASKIDDDIVRRDSLHAIINSLPDPNYATLRVLTLHLYRVAEHSGQNRMTASNLAICFGPTLMGQQGQGGAPGIGGDIRDAGWQARVVETILHNTFQIFDDDE